MKSLFFCLLLSSLLALDLTTVAQSPLPTLADTINIVYHPSLFGKSRTYAYRGIRLLGIGQVAAILKNTPDTLCWRLAGRINRRQRNYFLFSGVGYASILAGFRVLRQSPEVGIPLALGGTGLIYAGFIPMLANTNSLRKGVERHNLYLRSQTDNYANPVSFYADNRYRITPDDTVAILNRAGRPRFMYHNIRVYPDMQMKDLVGQLNTPSLTTGLRHTRTLRAVAGIVGSLAANYLVFYSMGYMIRSSRYDRWLPIDNRAYIATGLIGVSYGIGRIADNNQAQVMREYNLRVKGVRSEE